MRAIAAATSSRSRPPAVAGSTGRRSPSARPRTSSSPASTPHSGGSSPSSCWPCATVSPTSAPARRRTRKALVATPRSDDERFATPAAPQVLEEVAGRLRERNFEALVVADGGEARRVVLERIPEGAEVHSGKSKTLEDAGIFAELQRLGALRLPAGATAGDGPRHAGPRDAQADRRPGLHAGQRGGDHPGRR